MEKVLVCVMAQTRGYQVSWKSFKRHVLDELNADLALCISVDDDYDYMNPFWQHARWKWTVPEFDDFGDGYDQAQQWLAGPVDPELPDWRSIMQVQDQWLGGIKGENAHDGSGGIMIYFRWLLLHNIINEGLIEKYDRFIITRSDFVWSSPHPPMSILSRDQIWIPDGEYWGGLTDRHHVIPREYVVKSLNLIDDIVLYPENLQKDMSFYSEWNLETFVSFHFCREGLGHNIRKFPYVMFAIRRPEDRTRWSVGHFDEQSGLFIKYPTELNSCNRYAAIKTRADWRRLARDQPNLFSQILHGFDRFGLARETSIRLMTFHGTILFVDPENGEIKHGPIDGSPQNLTVTVLGDRRYLVHIAPDGSLHPMYSFEQHNDSQMNAGSQALQERSKRVRVVPVIQAHNCFGIEADGLYLSASHDHRMTWVPRLMEWESFQVLQG